MIRIKKTIRIIDDLVMDLNGQMKTYYPKDKIEEAVKFNARFLGHMEMESLEVKSINKINDTTWEIEYETYADSVFREIDY